MENVNCLRCRFRHEDNGNCTAVGGFCTAVPAAHCQLLREYLDGGQLMGKYITKEAALNTIFSEPPDARYPSWYAKRIKALPTADVAPVVHGRWIERQAPHAMGGISAKCSICSKSVQYLGNPLNYCPNCGAKMDGKNGC